MHIKFCSKIEEKKVKKILSLIFLNDVGNSRSERVDGYWSIYSVRLTLPGEEVKKM